MVITQRWLKYRVFTAIWRLSFSLRCMEEISQLNLAEEVADLTVLWQNSRPFWLTLKFYLKKSVKGPEK